MWKTMKYLMIILGIIICIGFIFPTWTKKKSGIDSISEMTKIQVNGTEIDIMVRGDSQENPILLFVHGGPANSEIPYVTQFQDLLEKNFVVVHYDQRASGKSFHFFENYENLSIRDHVEDLYAITDYLRERFDKEKIILVGHSFGTYISALAVGEQPEKYEAYIGVGQVADSLKSEMDSLAYCTQKAEETGNSEDSAYLQSIREQIEKQELITPRKYVRKYGGASIQIDDVEVLVKGLLFGTEYNLFDALTYGVGALYSQGRLLKEAHENPLPEVVKELKLPFYFIMGEQDYMTSVMSAKEYFDDIACDYNHEFIVYPECAHFPHFESEERFYHWMVEKFGNSGK